ncbi:hypothetical protein [Oceanisphaera arctica]|nr:hypothetical protein [Oceanisphaera arctica]
MKKIKEVVMCDYPEFLEEGKFSTLTALREVSAALTVQSQLLSELAEHGHYVPETLPSDQQVILLVIKLAYCGVSKELLHRPVSIDVHKVSYTGFSVRDWDSGNIIDSWQTEDGDVFDVNCAEDAVFWLPLPEHWQTVIWQGWGFPFAALRPDVPV